MNSEIIYWTKRWISKKGRSILYKIMPQWLIRESMMYASRCFEPTEVVPEIAFVTIFERVCKSRKPKND